MSWVRNRYSSLNKGGVGVRNVPVRIFFENPGTEGVKLGFALDLTQREASLLLDRSQTVFDRNVELQTNGPHREFRETRRIVRQANNKHTNRIRLWLAILIWFGNLFVTRLSQSNSWKVLNGAISACLPKSTVDVFRQAQREAFCA